MIKVTTLDALSTEFRLKFMRSSSTASTKLHMHNVYGMEVAVLDMLNYEDGVGKFRLTDAVHKLPFGRYAGSIMSGNCCCGCFQIEIPKCNISDAEVVPLENELHCDLDGRPERDCEEVVCNECCDNCSCDSCTGCSDCHPCDACHECWDDRMKSVSGDVVTTKIIYSQECDEAINQ